MNIIVTGSLGYVSTPLIKQLTRKEHSVTVISSTAERQSAIETLGATAAIGNMDDTHFLTNAFTGADAVYCMIASHVNFTDPANTAEMIIRQSDEIARSYRDAIAHSGVKRAVYLSSVGADMKEENGLIAIY